MIQYPDTSACICPPAFALQFPPHNAQLRLRNMYLRLKAWLTQLTLPILFVEDYGSAVEDSCCLTFLLGTYPASNN